MRMHLIAPFRTTFNLNSELIHLHTDDVLSLLNAATSSFSEANKDVQAYCPLQPEREGFRKFQTLSEDSYHAFTSPIAIFQFNQSSMRDIKNISVDSIVKVEKNIQIDYNNIDISNLELYLYDNTIGIIKAELHTDHVQEYFSSEKSILDRHMTELVSHAARHISNFTVAPFLDCLKDGQDDSRLWPIKSRLLRDPDEFLLQDAVVLAEYPKWPSTIDPVLWVNRTIILAHEEKHALPMALEWAHLERYDRDDYLTNDRFHAIQPGSNIFYNDNSVGQFLIANLKIQYFYTLFETLIDSQKRIYSRLFGKIRDSELRKQMNQHIYTSSFINYCISEYDDFLFSVQAERKHYAERLADQFDMSRLMAGLRSRSAMVREKIERLIIQRDQLRQRIIQGALVAIGSISLLEFGLNLSLFARGGKDAAGDGVPGPVDIAFHLPTDLLLSGLLSIIVLFTIFYARRWRS